MPQLVIEQRAAQPIQFASIDPRSHVRAGVELVAEAGIDAIRAKSIALTEFAIELVDGWPAALGVTAGTATTMVKTLALSGLAEYEPYSGVRLTASGERLAGLVLRRHRLVETFLVQVLGMSWDEVHDDAEQLEHVVSDRLIERMDEMLGRPTHDPHGDPIPAADGSLTTQVLPPGWAVRV